MRQYEMTYLVSDNVSESEITKVTGKIGGYVTDESGKVLKEESWGRRKLAYPILKQLFATYITMSFELAPEKLRNIEQDIKHENDIIRHLIVVRDFGKEELTLTTKDIADTKEIEEVVGGEKSFEAIEGETEESKDLMAVRGEEEEKDLSPGLETSSRTEELDAHRSSTQIDTDKVESEESKEDKTKKTEEKEEIKVEKPTKEKSEKSKTEKLKAESKKLEAKEDEPAKKQTVKQAVKKAGPKTEKPETIKSNEASEANKVKKVVKKKAVKKDESTSDEADRLAKLNEELDEILGEDL